MRTLVLVFQLTAARIEPGYGVDREAYRDLCGGRPFKLMNCSDPNEGEAYIGESRGNPTNELPGGGGAGTFVGGQFARQLCFFHSEDGNEVSLINLELYFTVIDLPVMSRMGSQLFAPIDVR